MKKGILTPKMAEKIQDGIFSKMASNKKIALASMLFALTKKLKESKTVLNESRGIAGKNN